MSLKMIRTLNISDAFKFRTSLISDKTKCKASEIFGNYNVPQGSFVILGENLKSAVTRGPLYTVYTVLSENDYV